jgi:pre-mRNA cleavage complex 2 protein Pcf11
VGSPYHQLFARNIYKTFMDAYTLLDPPVRRKMEELLTTWKEPPPTGIYSTPVFPVESTRKIENALLRAKTLALQLEQRRQREMAASGLAPFRSTPPPPSYPAPTGWNGTQVRASEFSGSMAHSFQNMVNAYPPTAPPPPPQMGPSNQDILLAEIRNLLTIVANKLILNPGDEEATRQAAALNQLQNILQTSVLPYEQVESVRQQLAALPIVQPPRQTDTPPVDAIFSDQNTDSLMQSLRRAGLLGENSSVSTPPSTRLIPANSPLSVNPNAVNLRHTDLELTTSSLQKCLP